MSEDRYRALRELPFDVLAGVLGFDFGKFKSRKNGSEFAGPCPVHAPKRNSTSFSYALDGKWNCFSCSAKGRGAIDLAMAVRKVGFQEAVAILEPHVGVALAAEAIRLSAKPKIQQVQVVPTQNEARAFTYEKYFQPSEWLQKRNLAPETLIRYGVGCYDNPARTSAYKGKIMIRIQRFSDGATVGYLVRDPRAAEERGDSPKYVFPAGVHKSLELFGAWQLREDSKLPLRVCYLVESPFTVMHFHQLGLPAVSPFGWSLSEAQIRMLAEMAKGLVCLPDRDKSEAFSPYAHMVSKRLWLRCPPMPEGVGDPEHLTADEIKRLT